MNISNRSALALSLFALAAISAAQPGNIGAITEARLKAHLEFIASDELEGRGTPSKGLDTAAKYIAAHLNLWGVKPGGDKGTYFQTFYLRRPAVNASGTKMSLGSTAMKFGEDFYARTTAGTADGEIVYVGGGSHTPGAADDPYAKVDVKGKVLLAFFSAGGGRRGQTQTLNAQAAAAKFGAKGVIMVSSSDAAAFSTAAANSTRGGGRGGGSDTVPTVIISEAALRKLLEGETFTADEFLKRSNDEKPGDPVALSSAKRVSFTVAVDENAQPTQNVIGIIEGSDPKLKSEYVVIGAHYDHLGLTTSGEDKVNNGADDDGSGTVGILEIAHAFITNKQRPKRSVMIIWHAGEERGLLGSRHFVENPTVPLTSITSMLNIDMIGRTKFPGMDEARNKMLAGPGAIYIVGTTRMSTELGPWAKDVNKKLLNLTYDFTYDDINHPERIFFRSDHYSYAEKGIPILFWFDGVHEDYHRPSDEVSKIDFLKMMQVTRTVGATAWMLANAKARPKSDIPLTVPGR